MFDIGEILARRIDMVEARLCDIEARVGIRHVFKLSDGHFDAAEKWEDGVAMLRWAQRMQANAWHATPALPAT